MILIDGYDGWALLSCDAGRDHWNTVMVSYFFSIMIAKRNCKTLRHSLANEIVKERRFFSVISNTMTTSLHTAISTP